MQEEIDPTLHRTVVVSTKLDTRLQQFAVAADARDFISPTEHFKGLKPLSGAPFFTSIPAGRVASDECDWTRLAYHAIRYLACCGPCHQFKAWSPREFKM